MILVGVGYIN